MKVDLFMLADRARIGDEGKLWIEGGGVTHFSGQTAPFVIPRVDVVLRLLFEAGDLGMDHTIEIRWRGPNEEEIDRTQPETISADISRGRPR